MNHFFTKHAIAILAIGSFIFGCSTRDADISIPVTPFDAAFYDAGVDGGDPMDAGPLEGRVCEFSPECSRIDRRYACRDGQCKLIDNSCDYTVQPPLTRNCYDDFTPADPMTPLLNPPCVLGWQVCRPTGIWSSCNDAVEPRDETGLLLCNGIDDDCDGCADGTLGPSGCEMAHSVGMDIVYAIDDSGSMGLKIAAVVAATNLFSTDLASASTKYGLIVFPGYIDGTILKVSDFADYAAFSRTLSALPTTTRGGQEGNWDVVYELATGEIPMNWRPGATRIIIVFTDEMGQTYHLPPITEAQMCSSLTHGEVVAFVVDPVDFPDYDECGMRFAISLSSETMLTELRTIISEPCE